MARTVPSCANWDALIAIVLSSIIASNGTIASAIIGSCWIVSVIERGGHNGGSSVRVRIAIVSCEIRNGGSIVCTSSIIASSSSVPAVSMMVVAFWHLPLVAKSLSILPILFYYF